MVEMGTRLPFSSNSGNLPPGCTNPRRNHACCAGVGPLRAGSSVSTVLFPLMPDISPPPRARTLILG